VPGPSAAVELLIRGFDGRSAAPGNPWIQPREHVGHWADLEAIPGNIGALSSGERAYLLITASIGLGGTDGPAINLSDTISALDREQLTLVLAGIAHANGSHQSSGIEIDPVTGTPSITRRASLSHGPNNRLSPPQPDSEEDEPQGRFSAGTSSSTA